jgi:hypothetical protein
MPRLGNFTEEKILFIQQEFQSDGFGSLRMPKIESSNFLMMM